MYVRTRIKYSMRMYIRYLNIFVIFSIRKITAFFHVENLYHEFDDIYSYTNTTSLELDGKIRDAIGTFTYEPI